MGTAPWDCKAWMCPRRRASSGSWGMSLSGNITSSSTGPTTRWGCPGCPELGCEPQVFPTRWLAGLVPFPALLLPPRTIKVWRSPPVPCLSGKGHHIPGNVACPWCHPQLHPLRMSLCPQDGRLDVALLIPGELPALGTWGTTRPSCPQAPTQSEGAEHLQHCPHHPGKPLIPKFPEDKPQGSTCWQG